jgi:hypothetical protein
VLTLMQTGKRELMPLVLLDAPGGTYWRDWLSFVKRNLLDRGMISLDDLSLMLVTDDVDATVADVVQFYRVFQSMQYVPEGLMFQLRSVPSAQQLATMNRAFADILTDGKFELHDPPPSEAADTSLASFTRLVFQFNRRNHGRLRKLVDWINAEVR